MFSLVSILPCFLSYWILSYWIQALRYSFVITVQKQPYRYIPVQNVTCLCKSSHISCTLCLISLLFRFPLTSSLTHCAPSRAFLLHFAPASKHILHSVPTCHYHAAYILIIPSVVTWREMPLIARRNNNSLNYNPPVLILATLLCKHTPPPTHTRGFRDISQKPH